VEIRQEVGEDNFFLFGLTTPEVYEMKAKGYNPFWFYEYNPDLKKCIDMIASGHFSPGETGLFRPLVDSLLYHDQYMLLADYQSYIDCQDRVAKAYKDQENWSRMSILNVARIGKFSSDRTIREYAEDIWDLKPVLIDLPKYDAKSQTRIRIPMNHKK
jgi:starch phosphorylase